MMTDTQRQADFPWLAGRTYLNTAAEGIPPQSVIDALHLYADHKKLGMDGRVLHEEQRRGCCAEVAAAYGLTPEEVAICSCSSEAYNLLALALNLQTGDEVVINDLDFPAGATPWLQSSCPATTRVWQHRNGGLRVDDLVPLLSPRTRLVTVSLVSFYNGFRLPLTSVVETVRRHSPALLAVDVTQALGRIALDLQGVDFIVSSTHKWILASHGGGLIGVPSSRAAQLTANAGGWFNLENAFAADRFERAITKPGAASYAVGMPNYAAIYAARAGLSYMRSWGVAEIERSLAPLVRSCLTGLKALPVELLTPDEPDSLAGIVAFRHPRATEIHQFLHQHDVHVMAHAGRLRIALHLYNSPRDVDRLLSLLAQALA